MKRNIALSLFLMFGLGIAYLSYQSPRDGQSNSLNFSVFFKSIGKGTHTLSRATTKMLPINDFDEKELGNEIKHYYATSYPAESANQKRELYLNKILDNLKPVMKKDFSYEIRLDTCPCPNAFALPGGVLFATEGLMKIMQSESELLAVLAHEVGHVELNHCFDAVKYRALSQKILNISLGGLADFARNLLIRHSFSQTQEDEADSYAFEFMKQSKYNPRAVSLAFQRLQDAQHMTDKGSSHIMRDYFRSHPPLEDRVKKYGEKARRWWTENPNASRYIGKENLHFLIPLSQHNFGDHEWVKHF